MTTKAITRLHFIGGEPMDVKTPAADTARLLWGTKPGDDAHDMGYAALIRAAAPQETALVNPSAVAYVTEEDKAEARER